MLLESDQMLQWRSRTASKGKGKETFCKWNSWFKMVKEDVDEQGADEPHTPVWWWVCLCRTDHQYVVVITFKIRTDFFHGLDHLLSTCFSAFSPGSDSALSPENILFWNTSLGFKGTSPLYMEFGSLWLIFIQIIIPSLLYHLSYCFGFTWKHC